MHGSYLSIRIMWFLSAPVMWFSIYETVSQEFNDVYFVMTDYGFFNLCFSVCVMQTINSGEEFLMLCEKDIETM